MIFEQWYLNVYVPLHGTPLNADGRPADCSKRHPTTDNDCLDRNDSEPCASCRAYAQACMDFEADQEGDN